MLNSATAGLSSAMPHACLHWLAAHDVIIETYYCVHQSVLIGRRSRYFLCTHIFALTWTLTYDLEFQSPASCGRDPHTCKKSSYLKGNCSQVSLEWRRHFVFLLSLICILVVVYISISSTALTCDIGSTVNQSTLTESAVSGPIVVLIDNAKLVSDEEFLYGDEPVILDVSPRVSIYR